MKGLLRGIVVNSFALWLTSQLVTGLKINGGLDVVLFAGLTLTLMNFLVRPILNLLTLPLNLLTMGFFSWIINVAIVYLLTVFVSQIIITSYIFPGFRIDGLSITSLHLGSFQTTILVAFVLSFITTFLSWLFRR